MGFQYVSIFRTTGRWPAAISVEFGLLEKDDTYSNFLTAMDLYCDGDRYDMNMDEFFVNERKYAEEIRQGICSDVRGLLERNIGDSFELKNRIDGLDDSYFVVKLYSHIKKQKLGGD